MLRYWLKRFATVARARKRFVEEGLEAVQYNDLTAARASG